MFEWLAMAVAAPALAAHGASAPMALRMHAADGTPRRVRLDLSLPAIPMRAAHPLVTDGMIVRDSLAPNATLGLGIASIGRRNISDFRPGQRSHRSHRPAVNFVLKF